jgi:metal-responsive CopG/Arc/MetJ family transcriptional regulator
MKRHNFFLPEDVVEVLKEMAAEKHTTYSELIRKAIVEYLKSHGRLGDS